MISKKNLIERSYMERVQSGKERASTSDFLEVSNDPIKKKVTDELIRQKKEPGDRITDPIGKKRLIDILNSDGKKHPLATDPKTGDIFAANNKNNYNRNIS